MDDIPQFCKRALLKKWGQWGELSFVNINISSINTRIRSHVYATLLDLYWLEKKKKLSVIKMTISITKYTVYMTKITLCNIIRHPFKPIENNLVMYHIATH